MQKWIKVSVACLMAITLLGSGEVSAATKAEAIATKQYKGLKTGMTVEEVAKVLYGKSYKKQLKTRKGSTVLKLPINAEDNSDGHKQLIQTMDDETKQSSPVRLMLQFMTKQKSTSYRLTTKVLFIERKTETTYRESTRMLVKGATLKNGMTEKQLDTKLTGTGLGNWTMLGRFDTTSAYTKEEQKKGYAVAFQVKQYVFKETNNKWKCVELTYDEQAKIYKISDVWTIKTKNESK